MVNTIVQYLLFKGMSKIATLRVNSQRQTTNFDGDFATKAFFNDFMVEIKL